MPAFGQREGERPDAGGALEMSSRSRHQPRQFPSDPTFAVCVSRPEKFGIGAPFGLAHGQSIAHRFVFDPPVFFDPDPVPGPDPENSLPRTGGFQNQVSIRFEVEYVPRTSVW